MAASKCRLLSPLFFIVGSWTSKPQCRGTTGFSLVVLYIEGHPSLCELVSSNEAIADFLLDRNKIILGRAFAVSIYFLFTKISTKRVETMEEQPPLTSTSHYKDEVFICPCAHC